MRLSIRHKLLMTYLLLVALAIVGISVPHYLITRRDKQRESRQRIQIAFDMLRHDFTKRVALYTTRFDEFLQDNTTLLSAVYSYSRDSSEVGMINFLFDHFETVAEGLKRFGRGTNSDRICLYGVNKQLLVVYQRAAGRETFGSLFASYREGLKYLNMDDASVRAEITFRKNNLILNIPNKPFPETPAPDGLPLYFADDIPDVPTVTLFQEQQIVGFRISVPIIRRNQKIAVLIGETFYTQAMIQEFAELSHTEINLFAGQTFSIGTLPAQRELPPAPDKSFDCATPNLAQNALVIQSLAFDNLPYYQAQCALKNAAGQTIGALTVSLSKAVEFQEIGKLLTTVVTIGLTVMAAALLLSILATRSTIQSIGNLVDVIGVVTSGDLRQAVVVKTHDEIGMVGLKFNQMIDELRVVTTQVHRAASSVASIGDAILQQMDALMTHTEQQATAVENTSSSLETINQFIDSVAHNTEELMSASAEILASIQESRASISEVTTSTVMLADELHHISSAVEQVNYSGKDISTQTEELAQIAQETEVEIHHIDRSFQEVSGNAEQTKALAKETMDAALNGQTSVETSMQGMQELKTVVAHTATIINEVNSWGEQVSSILDIVDEIAEQTTLLSLNASIISAQAGVHGRGFAVVADEIKNLATRTKHSTKEIALLVHKLQQKTGEGVKHTEEGIRKAEQGMQLSSAVKHALAVILDSATRTSNHADSTAHVIRQTTVSSRKIGASMGRVIEKVAHINTAVNAQIYDIEQVMAAVENIGGMSEQVSRASTEQRKAAEQIADNMTNVTENFETISDRIQTLHNHSEQIVEAMRMIERITELILQTASDMSEATVKNLVDQSQDLQQAVKMFKIS